MMIVDEENYTYIVAGDAMARLMGEKHPDRKFIPFCEDLSKGNYGGFSIDSDFIERRASFWNVSDDEYIKKLRPIINIDTTEKIVLCFGEDECCRANLDFMIGYLKFKGYVGHLRVKIVDEYSLSLLDEYEVEY